MPIKLEKEQFERRITVLPEDDLMEMYSEVYRILNVKALERISKRFEVEKKTKKSIVKQ